MANTVCKFESDGICYKTEEHNDICEDTSSTTIPTTPTKPTSSSLDILKKFMI